MVCVNALAALLKRRYRGTGPQKGLGYGSVGSSGNRGGAGIPRRASSETARRTCRGRQPNGLRMLRYFSDHDVDGVLGKVFEHCPVLE